MSRTYFDRVIERLIFLFLCALSGSAVFLPVGLIGSLLTGDWLGLLYLPLMGSVVGALIGAGQLVVSCFSRDTAAVTTAGNVATGQEAAQTLTATSIGSPVLRVDQLPQASNWKYMQDYIRHIEETIRLLSEQGFDGQFQKLEFIEYCRHQGDGLVRGIFHCTSNATSFVAWFLANQELATIQLPDHAVRNLDVKLNKLVAQSKNAASGFDTEYLGVANSHLFSIIWNDEGKLIYKIAAVPIGTDEPLEELFLSLLATHPDIGDEL